MEAGELLLIGATWTLLAFTLGASVAHRLEGRRPLVQPPWLVVLGSLTFVFAAVSVVLTTDRPTGVVTIDPFWWTAMDAVILGAAIVASVVRLRHLANDRSGRQAS